MLRIEGYLDTVEKIRAELISQSAAASQEVNVIPPEPPATYEEYVEEFAGSDAEDIVEVYE
jgi:hypothetical protein